MRKKTMNLMLSVFMIIVTLLCTTITAFAQKNDADIVADMRDLFVYGEGPKTDGWTLDYRYYSPVERNNVTENTTDIEENTTENVETDSETYYEIEADTETDNDTENEPEEEIIKYPLVVWLHGLSDGASEGKQLTESDISRWASPDFQARFTNGGAFILAPRSPENVGKIWNDKLVFTLRATIDDFIEKNSEHIDVSRIYIGGYSLGGKMTFKMIVAYPEMFAAAFPICPAWTPEDEEVKYISDMPVWLTSGKKDPLVSYSRTVLPSWENLVAVSNVKESCRFSTLTRTAYPDGTVPSNAHRSWFAVNNDMFAFDKGDYPYMETIDGTGNTITLTYPDGMISWLCGFTSDFDGAKGTNKGNLVSNKNEDINDDVDNANFKNIVENIVKIFKKIIDLLSSII